MVEVVMGRVAVEAMPSAPSPDHPTSRSSTTHKPTTLACPAHPSGAEAATSTAARTAHASSSPATSSACLGEDGRHCEHQG